MNNIPTPRISIITPLYNSEKYVGATIESVQNQTYRNYEHIIIDDCSSDNSYSIAKSKADNDNQIILLRNSENLRVAFTRNHGIDTATGDYILFLDSDDILTNDALEVLVNCFTQNSEAVIYTAPYQKMSEDGSKMFGIIAPPDYVSYKEMLKTCTMPFMTTIILRDIVKEHRLKNVHHEDYLFWLEILHDGKYKCFGYRDKPLGCYRLTANSLSRNKFKTFRYQWNIYRNEIKLGFFKSTYYFVFYVFNGLIKFLK